MNKIIKLIALILSIIQPGLGQVLMNRFLKGAVIYLSTIILACAILLINHTPWISPDKIYLGRLTIALVSIILLLWAYNLIDILKLTYHPSGQMEIEKQRIFREGLDYYTKGNLLMALPKFRQVVQFDPQDIDGILYLGMCCQKLGQLDKADKLFKKYMRLVGQSSALRGTLGKYLTDAKQYGIMELTKQPRPLTHQEYTEMKKHPQRGYEVLSGVPGLDKMVAVIALQHHERCDGKGYPQGIGMSQLDVSVQVISLVDTYESLTHPRPHRAKKPTDEALKMVLELKDQAFPKELIKILIEQISFYPPGARVQLNTGEIGEVVSVNKDAPLKPCITITTDAQGNNLSTPRELDLKQSPDFSISRVII
jgi:tetratricopeptide (TPR) repeat protein